MHYIIQKIKLLKIKLINITKNNITIMKGYMKKYTAQRLRDEFEYIENLTKEINNQKLTIAIERYKDLLHKSTADFVYKVPENISMDGIVNYHELPKVKENIKINKNEI